jgi:N-carbamoyl-L-amino-acid hydrolase
MLDLARTVLSARSRAEEHDALATIGRVRIVPGGTNAVPSQAQAWLDARGPDEAVVRALVGDISRDAGVPVSEESWTNAVDFHPGLRGQLAALLEDAPQLPTGAGHDAGILASAGVPAAMLFVRNPTGISHSPAEHADRADCLRGVEALAAALEQLTRSESSR